MTSTPCWRSSLAKALLSRTVGFTFTDPDAAGTFGTFLDYLPEVRSTPDWEYSIARTSAGVTVAFEGREICQGVSALEACFLVEQHACARLLPGEPDALVLHAAAVRHLPTGTVVVLPGGPRSGKTTLSLAALQSGRFLYLSEDCLGVDRDPCESIPLSRALRWRGVDTPTIDTAEWRAHPLDRLPVTLLVPSRERVTRCPREPAPSLAVFPSFARHCAAEAQPLTRGEVLARLAAASVNEISSLRNGGFDRLRALAGRTPGVALAWSDAAAAIRKVESLLPAHGVG